MKAILLVGILLSLCSCSAAMRRERYTEECQTEKALYNDNVGVCVEVKLAEYRRRMRGMFAGMGAGLSNWSAQQNANYQAQQQQRQINTNCYPGAMEGSFRCYSN